MGVALLASVFSSYGDYGSRTSFVDGLVPAVIVGRSWWPSAHCWRCACPEGQPAESAVFIHPIGWHDGSANTG